MEYLIDGRCFSGEGCAAKIELPFYFPSGNRLTLTAAGKGGSVYVSDNGAAYRELASRTDDPYILGDVFDYIVGVFLNAKPTERREIVWAVSPTDMRRFYRVLQCVSLSANADLYPAIDGERLGECAKYTENFELPAESYYPSDFVEALKTSLRVKEDLILTPFAFDGESSPMRVQTEKRDGLLTLTDRGDFDGGDLIERIKWFNRDDYHQFDGMINKVCERFGAGYDGRKVRYAVSEGSQEALTAAVFTLMQVMSVLGELGITVRTDSDRK